jgi:DNA-binding transcriptional MerR regulator
MTEPHYRLPNEVAAQLQVSPSTLRRWSDEFADYLSGNAGHPSPASDGQPPMALGGQPLARHRRYTDADLETLLTIKSLLAEGMSYIQTGKRLEALRLRKGQPVVGMATPEGGETPSGANSSLSLWDASPIAPAVTVLADTLHTVAEGQQLLLGSQQANRDLLTVVLQDNFTLKEENAKLRDRMLELERDLTEGRRLDGLHRETVESRLLKIEDQLRPKRVKPALPPAENERKGCLAQIFGPLS